MALLEQVTQMKDQGLGDDQIIENLQQQGSSPQEIQDALSQSQVKSAVAGEQQSSRTPEEYSVAGGQAPENPGAQDYGGGYAPQAQEAGGESYPQENYEQGYESQSPQQEGYGGYAGAESTGTDNMIEIAEQVFSEKIKKLDKKINEFSEFKTLIKTKVDSFETRLKRIETMIDQLQIKILGKISNYGRDLEKTKKEVAMVEDSFGKMVNKIADKSEKKIIMKKSNVKKNIKK